MATVPMRIASDTAASIPAKRRFNVTTINSATCPKGKDRVFLWDESTPGLALRVTSNGSKSFYLYKKVAGRPVRIRIGGWPEMKIEQARHRMVELNAELAKGSDPQAAKRKRREEATVREMFQHWIETHAKLHKRERSWRDDEKTWERYLKSRLSGRRLSSVSQADVAALHAKIGAEHGIYCANRALALLSAMFGMSGAAMGFTGANPCKGVRRFKEEKRERFLSGDELRRFIEALDAEPSEVMKDYIWLLLLTGARRGNVASMTWDELDFDRAVWSIPAGKAKAGETIAVPLVSEAVEILRRRMENRERGVEWVFPGRRGGSHLVEPKLAFDRICERAGITGLRPHDLRHTAASWQIIAGSSLAVVGRALGHRSVQTTSRYSHLTTDPVRASMAAGVDAMLKAAQPAKDDAAKKNVQPKKEYNE